MPKTRGNHLNCRWAKTKAPRVDPIIAPGKYHTVEGQSMTRQYIPMRWTLPSSIPVVKTGGMTAASRNQPKTGSSIRGLPPPARVLKNQARLPANIKVTMIIELSS